MEKRQENIETREIKNSGINYNEELPPFRVGESNFGEKKLIK